jgi:SSS family solute:Na+ symporter
MRIHPLDLAIVIAYLLGVTALGVHFRRGQQDAKDYFLGGRTAPWWALAFSIVATETSTLTIIGTPAISYGGNLTFIQLVFGYLIGRVLIVLLLLPGYFRGEFFTAYALIEKRFGERMRAVAASTFLITRAIAEGVRISAIALVVSVVLGTSERLAVIIVVALTVLYTFEGGMRAVIWTDVSQLLLYLTGSVVTFFVLLHSSHASRDRRWPQTAGLRFLLESRHDIHLLVRPHWRGVSHHGQPRHRPDHRAAFAGCKE